MLDMLRRTEGIQRIQLGLSGLAGVVLLVGLANIVVDNVRREDASKEAMETDPLANSAATQAAAPPPVQQPTEPLAELGVTPSAAPQAEPPVVQDLQPDPNLREPMDVPSPDPPQTSPSQPVGQPKN